MGGSHERWGGYKLGGGVSISEGGAYKSGGGYILLDGDSHTLVDQPLEGPFSKERPGDHTVPGDGTGRVRTRGYAIWLGAREGGSPLAGMWAPRILPSSSKTELHFYSLRRSEVSPGCRSHEEERPGPRDCAMEGARR